MPRPARPNPSKRPTLNPLRTRCAAAIVPEKPPPTIATSTRLSDLIVGPGRRVGGAGLALGHMLVKIDDGPPGGLGKQARHHGMDQARHAGADHARANAQRANPMARPAHAERPWMLMK